MNVGVTGATGFIGRHLVAALVARGHDVRSLVRPAFDLARPEGFADAVSGLDAVIHAAAYIPKSYTDPAEARPCLEYNALATLALLEAATRAGLRRFVYVSGNVYRQSAEPVREDAPTYPAGTASFYITSKLAGEIWTEHIAATSNLATVSLRVAAPIGPGLARGMVPTFTTNLLAGKPIVVKDGGRYRSDVVFVGDVATAAVAATERDGARGIYNVGSGTTSSSLEIARALLELTGATTAQLEIEPATGTAVALGFAPLDITRARSELGYAPVSLEQTLEAYVAWHRAR